MGWGPTTLLNHGLMARSPRQVQLVDTPQMVNGKKGDVHHQKKRHGLHEVFMAGTLQNSIGPRTPVVQSSYVQILCRYFRGL